MYTCACVCVMKPTRTFHIVHLERFFVYFAPRLHTRRWMALFLSFLAILDDANWTEMTLPPILFPRSREKRMEEETNISVASTRSCYFVSFHPNILYVIYYLSMLLTDDRFGTYLPSFLLELIFFLLSYLVFSSVSLADESF